MKMSKWFYVLPSTFLLAGVSGCGKPNSDSEPAISKDVPTVNNEHIATAQITNPSAFPRPHQMQYFSYYDLGLDTSAQHNIQTNLLTKNNVTSIIPTESIDLDLDGIQDGILVDIPLDSAEQVNIAFQKLSSPSTLEKRTQAEVSHKVDGEWVAHSKYPNTDFREYVGGTFENVTELTPPPQYTDHSNWVRYEGPGIESDKVGYRIYSDWRNGFDIFGKLTPAPSLQKIGQDGYDSYHNQQEWGMDVLKVGSSLGAGGFGLWHDEKLSLVSEVDQHTVRILENGALRSAFSVDYKGWQSEVGKQNLSANFSMQAGSSLVHTNLNFASPVATMAIGIVKHEGTELIKGDINITGKAYSYIASWGKQALDGSYLGMAVFFKKENVSKITSDDKNYLVILSPKGAPTDENANAQQLSYYFDATWQPQSNIGNKDAYKEYLQQQAEQLTIQPRVQLKTTASKALQDTQGSAENALIWSQKLADSELQRKGFIYNYDGWDINRKRLPKFEYDIVGLYPQSLYKLGLATGKEDYKQGIQEITASFIEDDGNIKRFKLENYNIDSVAPGMAVLSLFEETKEEKFKLAADLLHKQLESHPRTSEGAFWHKEKYPHQLWLDGVYMGMPFMAKYDVMFNNGKHLKEVVKEFELTEHYLRDPDTGLYFHAWDEMKQQDWADKTTGLSPEIWARGAGWLAMALVDVLDIIPQTETELRAPLLKMSKDLANALVKYQDPTTGTWWQVMDKPEATGNYRESSASAMFTYFLAKSVANHYIDASYAQVTRKAYNGLINEFVLVHHDGTISMTNQCYVAGLGFGRDGSYGYYMSEPVWKNDPKGTGPFILAGIAVNQMMKESNNGK